MNFAQSLTHLGELDLENVSVNRKSCLVTEEETTSLGSHSFSTKGSVRLEFKSLLTSACPSLSYM